MTAAVFLQVRMDSTRLPGKALKPLSGQTVIEHAMSALKKVPADHHILVTATGDEPYFKELAEKKGFSLFAGSRQDVLDRFIQAGKAFNPEICIRATGDNPLVAYEPAALLLDEMRNNPDMDYLAMTGLPLGCGVEVFRYRHLETAAASSDPYDHEHVTPYIYHHPEQFRLKYYEAPVEMASSGRVTLDTREDYESIRRIFDDLYRNSPIGIKELVRYLKSHE